MRYPHKNDRWLFFWACLLAALVSLAGIGLNLFLRLKPALLADPLEVACLVLDTLFLIGLTALLSGLTLFLLKGPPNTASSGIKSQEGLATLVLIFCTFFVDSVALRLIILIRDEAYESLTGLVLGGLFAFPMAIALTLGSLWAIPKLIFTKRSCLIMPPEVPVAGDDFHGQVEMPLPAHRAPELIATLKLIRSVSDSIEFTGIPETVWSQEVRIRRCIHIGPRKCRGRFHFTLDGPKPVDFPGGGTFNWELVVRSADPKRRPFSAVFEVPIAFHNPVSEGIVADRRIKTSRKPPTA